MIKTCRWCGKNPVNVEAGFTQYCGEACHKQGADSAIQELGALLLAGAITARSREDSTTKRVLKGVCTFGLSELF